MTERREAGINTDTIMHVFFSRSLQRGGMSVKSQLKKSTTIYHFGCLIARFTFFSKACLVRKLRLQVRFFFTYGVDSCLSSLRHHSSFFSIAQNAYCYPVLATFHVITALGSVLFVYSSYHVSPPSKLDNSCACFTDNSVSCSSSVTPNGCRDIVKNNNKSSELCQNSIIAVEQINTVGYIIDASNI